MGSRVMDRRDDAIEALDHVINAARDESKAEVDSLRLELDGAKTALAYLDTYWNGRQLSDAISRATREQERAIRAEALVEELSARVSALEDELNLARQALGPDGRPTFNKLRELIVMERKNRQTPRGRPCTSEAR